MALTPSLKQCLNLCSFKWLSPSLRRVISLTPRGSYIEKIDFSLFSLTIIFLKMLRDFAFLTLVSRLFHSFMQKGKYVFLKVFVLDGKGLMVEFDTDLNG